MCRAKVKGFMGGGNGLFVTAQQIENTARMVATAGCLKSIARARSISASACSSFPVQASSCACQSRMRALCESPAAASSR